MLTFLLILSNLALAESWDDKNTPKFFENILKKPLIYKLSELPKKAHLSDPRLGWSETNWPTFKRGIAFRWNHPDKQTFNEFPLTKEQVLRMSKSELSQLSPSELFDISRSDYDFTLTNKVLLSTSASRPEWEGICNGRALAAANYPEPKSVVIKNKENIEVPFGSSDVKALLSYYHANKSMGDYAHAGQRCYKDDDKKGICKGVNAGAFHVVLTNMLGLSDRSVIMDIDPHYKVFNHPIIAYSVQLSGVQVIAKVTYGDELNNVSYKSPVIGTKRQVNTTKVYEYILEINEDGNITGGEWISEDRPDFVWTQEQRDV